MQKFKIRPETNRGHFSGSGRRGEFNGSNEKARNWRSEAVFDQNNFPIFFIRPRFRRASDTQRVPPLGIEGYAGRREVAAGDGGLVASASDTP